MKTATTYGALTGAVLIPMAGFLVFLIFSLNEGLGEGKRFPTETAIGPFVAVGVAALAATLGFAAAERGVARRPIAPRDLLPTVLVCAVVGGAVSLALSVAVLVAEASRNTEPSRALLFGCVAACYFIAGVGAGRRVRKA